MRLVKDDSQIQMSDLIFARVFAFGCGIMSTGWVAMGKPYWWLAGIFFVLGMLEPQIVVNYINKRRKQKALLAMLPPPVDTDKFRKPVRKAKRKKVTTRKS